MQKKISLRKNIISFDKSTLNKTVDEIISSRFNDWNLILNSTINDLHDPYLLKDMDKAVERIKFAKEKNQRIIIFWDYDVDGVTATSILMHLFITLWMQASYRLPDRVKDGYWLKKYFVDELAALSVDLIITVDCWTRDLDVIKYAKEKWIDVIITDHHSVPDIISEDAIAMINPKRLDCNYSCKDLSGAWVAFKLMHALVFEFMKPVEAKQYIQETIDIAAIWTVADCMNLIGENRIIVKEWLKQIKNSRSLWIRMLINARLNEDFDADLFGFHIWPRLNAAWRMGSPYTAVNLILNNSSTVNRTLIEIEKLNEIRKYQTKEFFDDAINKINKQDNIIFYISPAIEHWIIWIVAWRITEQFYKPCICLKDEWDKLVGSCRSPEFFSIIEILEEYRDYFIAFGWHKQAAWFTISKDKFGEFKTKIINRLNKLDFNNHKKSLDIDKVVRLEELGFNFLDIVNKFKPFWIWNPKPIFMVENIDYEKLEFLWKWRDHLKFTTKHWFKIFAFFMWDYYEEIKRSKKNVSIVFELNEDTWMGNKNLMLKVVDIVLE